MIEVIIAICALLIMKLAAIIAGYGIIKMGYEALVKGVKGEFDFGGKAKNDFEFKLVSASPGLFFVLFGSFIIVWSLFVKQPLHFQYDSDWAEVKNGKPAPEQSQPPAQPSTPDLSPSQGEGRR